MAKLIKKGQWLCINYKSLILNLLNLIIESQALFINLLKIIITTISKY